MKDVSRLSGVPYGTVRGILRRFKNGQISLGVNPLKSGPKDIMKDHHKKYLKKIIDEDIQGQKI